MFLTTIRLQFNNPGAPRPSDFFRPVRLLLLLLSQFHAERPTPRRHSVQLPAMVAQLCYRRHLARAESAALACHAAVILLFATMPSFLSMSAWRTLLAAGCIALLVLHDWPRLALCPASRPSAVSPRIAAADSPSAPPPSPADDGQTAAPASLTLTLSTRIFWPMP